MVAEYGVVFDLDDTLVWERDYVRSGFRAVARSVAGAACSEAEAFGLLWGRFEEGARGDLFDQLLAAYPLSGVTVPGLVARYREHAPALALAPEVWSLLDGLRSRARLALITDGPLASQQAKVTALGLADVFEVLVLTGTWGEAYWKPHRRPYEAVMEGLGLPAEALVYVGDNPGKDFVTARELGWRTIRLRHPRQLRHDVEPPSERFAADQEVRSIEALREALDVLVR